MNLVFCIMRALNRRARKEKEMANLREWFLALAVVVLLSLGREPASANSTTTIPNAAGFQDYIIAVSNFQWCHGFASIHNTGKLDVSGHSARRGDAGSDGRLWREQGPLKGADPHGRAWSQSECALLPRNRIESRRPVHLTSHGLGVRHPKQASGATQRRTGDPPPTADSVTLSAGYGCMQIPQILGITETG